MAVCNCCQNSIPVEKQCPTCGNLVYSATGKIIYGATAEDMSFCAIHVTDRYIVVNRMTKKEVNSRRYSGAVGGLIGAIIVDAATTKKRDCGYYPLQNIERGIFPYQAKGIKGKVAMKLFNKDGTDVILIVDQPSFWDSQGKALKKTVEAIRERIPKMDDGKSLNYGSVLCQNPYVTVENFDQIPPLEATAPAPAPVAAPAPATPPAAQAVAAAVEVAAAKAASPLVCAHCGAELEEKDKFCPICGEKVEVAPPPRRCAKCGEILEERDKFCSICGEKVPPLPRVCAVCGETLEEKDKFCSICGTPV